MFQTLFSSKLFKQITGSAHGRFMTQCRILYYNPDNNQRVAIQAEHQQWVPLVAILPNIAYFYKPPIEALHLMHTNHIVNLQTGKNYWLTFCIGNSTRIFVSEGAGGYFINEFVKKVLHLQSAKEAVPACCCSSQSPPQYCYKQYSLSTYEL